MIKNNNDNKPSFSKIFFLFLKISIFSFGGGNAIFPLIKKYCVDKYNWISEKDMDDILVVTNSIPGASAVEAMSYISYLLLKSKWKTFIIVVLSLLPHTVLFFVIFYLGVKFIPLNYLKVIYVAVIPIIIALLLGMVIRYSQIKSKSFPVTIHWLIFTITLLFCVFVPVPWNIPAFIILFFLLIFLIYTLAKNKKEKKND